MTPTMTLVSGAGAWPADDGGGAGPRSTRAPLRMKNIGLLRSASSPASASGDAPAISAARDSDSKTTRSGCSRSTTPTR